MALVRNWSWNISINDGIRCIPLSWSSTC